MFIAYVITVLIINACRNANPYKAEKWFRRLQLVSSAAFSIGHGGSDSQKVIGIITASMIVFSAYLSSHGMEVPHWAHIEQITDAAGKTKFGHVPNWIPISCYTCIGLGTMMGGWRIVKTMGTKITKVTPLEGVAADCRCHYFIWCISRFRCTCKYHSHYCGFYHGSGYDKAPFSCTLGCIYQPALGMGINHPCKWFISSSYLFHPETD